MRRLALLFLLSLGASTAGAQDARPSIDPGMSREAVVSRLGPPAAQRSAGAFTYLFYQNGCERLCGMQDLVILENDAVVDAIFRAPYRAYTGKSSSPHGVLPQRTPAGEERASPPSGAAPETGGAAAVLDVAVEVRAVPLPAAPMPQPTGESARVGGASPEPRPAACAEPTPGRSSAESGERGERAGRCRRQPEAPRTF